MGAGALVSAGSPGFPSERLRWRGGGGCFQPGRGGKPGIGGALGSAGGTRELALDAGSSEGSAGSRLERGPGGAAAPARGHTGVQGGEGPCWEGDRCQSYKSRIPKTFCTWERVLPALEGEWEGQRAGDAEVSSFRGSPRDTRGVLRLLRSLACGDEAWNRALSVPGAAGTG